MGASTSSYNPNPTPYGSGGGYTESQYRNQLASAQQHYDTARTHAIGGGNGSAYCNRQVLQGDYKNGVAARMLSKGIQSNASASSFA